MNYITRALAFIALTLTTSGTLSAKQPNILILMADDLGYSDLSCFGSENIKTPVLDKLSTQGMKFTDFYAAAPNCSPSRAGMLTGRFSSRVGMYSYVPPNSPMHLRVSEVTSAELLKQAGYETAHVGKWHLCSDLTGGTLPTPAEHGFDYWLGTENNALPSHADPVNFVRNGKAIGKQSGYSCDLVAKEAMYWLSNERDKTKPFFLNVWFHEPHARVAAPAELVARHQGKSAVYFACVENMDRAIGRLLDYLDDNHLADNTFVMFTSDNGSYRQGSNGNLRASKSFVWEGGIREPTMVRWPGHVKAGSQTSTPAGGVDVLPTLCEMAGITPPQDRRMDGVSLVSLLEGKEIKRTKPLVWFFYRTDPACAMRDGRWSLVGYLDPKVPKGHSFIPAHMKYLHESKLIRFELHDLVADPGQTNELSKKHPEVLKKLSQKMIELHAEIIEDGPVWFENPPVD